MKENILSIADCVSLVAGPEGAARAQAEETPQFRARWSCQPAAWPPASPATADSRKSENINS